MNKKSSSSKLLKIMELLVNHPQGIGLTKIAKSLSLSSPSVHRFMSILMEEGWVDQNQHKKYFLTFKITSLGEKYLRKQEIREIAHPFLLKLRDQVGETIHLGVLQGNLIVYLDKIDSKQTIQLASHVGSSVPCHCTALGKIILAFSDEEKVKSILSTVEWIKYTENTIDNIDDFVKELFLTKERGYSIDNVEWERGIRCFAAPIMNYEKKVIAAVSVSGPAFLQSEEVNKNIISNMLNISKEISMSFGSTN